MTWKTGIIILAALAISGEARAQTAPTDPRWSDNANVVAQVTVPALCPAMWKLTRGDATVWIMPTLYESQNDAPWDSRCFKRKLKGAKALLVQDDYVWVPAEKTYLPHGQRLKDVVSPETYARYLAAAKRVHEFPGAYDSLRPGWAANYFVTRALQMQGITQAPYPDNLKGLARNQGVKIMAVRFFAPDTAQRSIRNTLDAAGQEACLNSILDRVDYTFDVLPDIIAAWRQADLATVLRLYPHEDHRCDPPETNPDTMHGNENINAWTRVLADALNTPGPNIPGKTVAAIPLSWLLSRNSVLDQLQAAGVTITPPQAIQAPDAED